MGAPPQRNDRPANIDDLLGRVVHPDDPSPAHLEWARLRLTSDIEQQMRNVFIRMAAGDMNFTCAANEAPEQNPLNDIERLATKKVAGDVAGHVTFEDGTKVPLRRIKRGLS